MNIFICCAGNSTRWNNYMNIEKQLVDIDGTPLIVRTINQIIKYLNYNKIYLLVSSTNKNSFLLEPIINNCEIIELTPQQTYNVPALYSVQNYLNNNVDNRDVLLLLGDVYFSDEAFIKIKNNIIINEVAFFGRITNIEPKKTDNLNNMRYDELFAFYFSKNIYNQFKDITTKVKKLYDLKQINRFIHWEILTYYYTFGYKIVNGTQEDIKVYKTTFNDRYKLFNNNFIIIDDLTDDFDFSYDYENFINNYYIL